ncbi:MAG: deoxyhypusine synthase [Candidatus Parvarchaeota archaeon]|nr:deoxyhypusine synthase [Candidatus Parvarchaeota archaeon]
MASLGKKVENIKLDKKSRIADLMAQFSRSGGFTARKLADAFQIFKDMEADKNCFKFLSFPADIISTGTRGVIVDLVKNRMVDAVITTAGMMDHDLARLWRDYYTGTEKADDAKLRANHINRLYDIFIPDESYGYILEDKLKPMIAEAAKLKKEYATNELISFIGERIKDEKKADETITYWAWKNKIPVVIPGFTDGSFGSQIWMYTQKDHDFKINPILDENLLADIVFTAKRTGALMIGGGISKHHTIWWNLFRGGLDYAIYMTTAVEWDGSLSGAKLTEAVSWGKVKPKARYIDVEGDATILLPLLYGAYIETK